MLKGLCFLIFSVASGQRLTFDAATLKPAPKQPPNVMVSVPPGGPGTSDPGRIRYRLIGLKRLITIAYNVKDFQISGPDWLASTRFDVEATMPPSTTKEQFRIMLQNLLADRFKLAIHRETKELPTYQLEVAKGGIKMKESMDGKASEPFPAAYGFPAMPADTEGRPRTMELEMKGRGRLIGYRQTTEDLADHLLGLLARPVIDATGLTAKYDFALTFSMEGFGTADTESPPDVFSALQSQLGLRLEPKKGPIELIVIDHIERAPTEN